MHNIKVNHVLTFALAVGLVLISGCKPHAEGDGHDHGTEAPAVATEENHDEESGVKEVHLNEAQYKAASIILGGFEQKNLSEVINANGYTKLPPQNQAQVSVYVSGIIKSIKVIEGQYVKAGQTIATVQSPEYAQLQEEYLTSKSNLDFLKLEYERQKTLSEQNVNSKKVFQKTQAELQVEQARFKSLDERLTLMNIPKSGNISSVVGIKAPISGHVTEVDVNIGSSVEAGKSLFTIIDNSKMHVDLLVYEKDLYKVKQGQAVRFVLTNQNNAEIKGKIFSVGKAFENETKSVAVHADILNDKQMLIPGMYVNALIDVGSNTVPALPQEAVVAAEGRQFIFILNEEGEEDHSNESDGHEHKEGESDNHTTQKTEEQEYHFTRIEVKPGTVQLGYVQVTPLQPLPKGAEIVVKGAYYLQSHLIKSEGGGGHEH
ncbi:MAG: efflux RND transporter periplasmic adaptor subunit [Chitinophagales bacterium]|nr:efflux RND transporter periplasmic adaptor subunit [Chitinophagales bacterium]